MKTMKRRLALTAAMAALALSPSFAADAKTVGYMGIGDVKATLTEAGNLAGQFDPSVNGDSLKAMVGMMLGDAALSGLDKEAGVVVFLTADESPVVFLEVNEAKAKIYAETLKKQMMNPEIVDGMLMISLNPKANVEACKACAPAAKEYLSKPGTAKLDIHINLDETHAKYSEKLSKFAEQMAQDAAKSDEEKGALVGKLMIGGAAFVEGFWNQQKTMDIGVALVGDKLELNFLNELKADSELAKVMKTDATLNPEMIKSLPAENMVMRSVSISNPKEMEFFLGELIKACKAAKYDDPKLFAKLQETAKTYAEAFGEGNVATAQSMPKLNGTDAIGAMYALADAKDPAKALGWFEKETAGLNELVANLTKDTSFTVSMKYDKNAGDAAGAKFDKFTLTAKMPETDKPVEISAKMAAGDKKLMVTSQEADMAKLVELAKTPGNAPAIDAPKLPEGFKAVYVGEYDAMSTIKAGMEDAMNKAKADEKAVLEKLKSPDLNGKITFAAGVKDNVTAAKVDIQLKPFIALGKIIKEESEKEMAKRAAEAAAEAAKETSGSEDMKMPANMEDMKMPANLEDKADDKK